MLDRFTWFRQSAFLWRGDGLTVYIDPWGVTTDDKADVLFITHAHYDHFQPDEIEKVRKRDTKIFAPADVARELSGNVTPVKPGDAIDAGVLKAQAVPAYNTVEERLEMHPKKNNWVGYVITLGSNVYYHAGDTDHAPELSEIRADVAFLPIGGTYTMDAPEAAEMAKALGPKLAVPMHFGFVVGTPTDAERFAKEADPIKVQILEPTNPFEKE
jgi:L-ascorbate metabolism protein UlaG (beta-lactamase superfamily)